METKLRLSTLSIVAFNLVSAIDHGFLEKITFDEIYREIESGNLIAFLKSQLGDSVDLSLVTADTVQGRRFIEALQRLPNVLAGNERRKLGVENSGLCLLLAFCIELMQHLESYEE
jgi:hypothetical protein